MQETHLEPKWTVVIAWFEVVVSMLSYHAPGTVKRWTEQPHCSGWALMDYWSDWCSVEVMAPKELCLQA